jgi:alpha-1,2-glucosyltransferase
MALGGIKNRTRSAARNAGSRVKSPRAATSLPVLRDTFYDRLVLILVVVLCLMWAMHIMTDHLHGDEGFHWPATFELMQGGDYATNISALPGYHYTIAYLMKFLSLESLSAARLLTWLIAVTGLGWFYRMVRKTGEGNPSALTLQVYLSPLIFPFFFLIYTDTVSLSLVLLSLLLTLNGSLRAGALIAGISMVFRQTNIVWLFLFWLLALSELGFFRTLREFNGFKAFKFRELAAPLLKTYVFPVFCLIFVAYFLINKGVAHGDTESQHLSKIYPTQIFLLLACFFFLFLPMHLRNAPAIWRLLKSKPALWLLGALLYGVYMITFYADHGYNHIDFYLRNVVLRWLRDSMLIRSLLFIPMLWAFYNLFVTPLREKKYYWFYPVVVLYLLPIELIEQRYYIVPIVLFMLFRKPMDDRREYLTAGIYVLITMFLFTGITNKFFFL